MKYSTNPIKKLFPMILALLFLASMIALNLAVKEPELEPDAVYPMTNVRVSWLQSFHDGGWEE